MLDLCFSLLALRDVSGNTYHAAEICAVVLDDGKRSGADPAHFTARPHDPEHELALDRHPARVFDREEGSGHLGTEHRVVLDPLVVGILEEPPFFELQPVELGVVGGHVPQFDGFRNQVLVQVGQELFIPPRR